MVVCQDGIIVHEQPLFYEEPDVHENMRLDVDDMSYEDLLALEDQIGNGSTGLSEEAILAAVRQHCYLSMKLGPPVEEEPCLIDFSPRSAKSTKSRSDPRSPLPDLWPSTPLPSPLLRMRLASWIELKILFQLAGPAVMVYLINNAMSMSTRIFSGHLGNLELANQATFLEDYVDGKELGNLNCGHEFHFNCIKQWLVRRITVPFEKRLQWLFERSSVSGNSYPKSEIICQSVVP
ncbi:putative E3 ubiquitin-protein ligase HIP1 [Camellia lanceoleosa]|uniref:E3 ubiquitin-protein ligase HIP1 n=1 Tax=Camellia lanceoleosa TaxID=1840588 RepID=A0ACC0IM04_9ERIC|nr:putative E3 ubiquitin-protein ligase HIP1 [Camellia lanceoleosa]